MSQHPDGPPTPRLGDGDGGGTWQQVKRAQWDPECIDELVTTVTLAVAEAKGVDPLDHEALPQLYEAIDLHSVENSVCEPEPISTDQSEASEMHFFYAGHKIHVGTDGWVRVYERQ